MGQSSSTGQPAAAVSPEHLSSLLANRFAKKCFTPLELAHFRDVFSMLADNQDGLRYWKEESLCRFLCLPDTLSFNHEAPSSTKHSPGTVTSPTSISTDPSQTPITLGPGPVMYQMATYLGAFPFPSLAPSILTGEALLKVVVIMTERYKKVLKGGTGDRRKLLFRSLAVFDRRMSSVAEKMTEEERSRLRAEKDLGEGKGRDRDGSEAGSEGGEGVKGEKDGVEGIRSHVAGFSIDEPGYGDDNYAPDEEEEDDDELALAALDSLDAFEVYKSDSRHSDTKIHHAQIPVDNFRRLITLLLIIAPLTAQQNLALCAEYYNSASEQEHLQHTTECILNSFLREGNSGISYHTFNTIVPSALPYMFDGLNPLFEHFLFSKNFDLSRRKREASAAEAIAAKPLSPTNPASPTSPSAQRTSFSHPSLAPNSVTSPTTAAAASSSDPTAQPLLLQPGEILTLSTLSHLSFFIPGSTHLFHRLRPLYSGLDSGFSLGSFESHVLNWRAPSILLVGGTRLSNTHSKLSSSERAFTDKLPPKRFPDSSHEHTKTNKKSRGEKVTFGAYLSVPWKHTPRDAIGNQDTLLFQLAPTHRVFKASNLVRDYATFTHESIGFGTPPPRKSAAQGRYSSSSSSGHTVSLGPVSLWLNASLAYGVFTHDASGGGAFHTSPIPISGSSDTGSNIGSGHNSRSHATQSWQDRFEIESLEIWGCGGDEEAEQQRKAWEFEEREAAARRGIKFGKDVEADRALLEMVGLVGNSRGDSGGSMG
ncbi:Restriction of telomere capping protein 5 [Agyrium rufum]|nr:Restriction of telomere capping protein 5 [Agyrium rufum]